MRQYTLNGEPRPVLNAGQLNGMLKGFIDLWSSSTRAATTSPTTSPTGSARATRTSITPAALSRFSVLHHRYELQYVLYLLALHRLLRSRLPGYDYERHVGGAVYVFLRGRHASPGQGLHCERPPKAF